MSIIFGIDNTEFILVSGIAVVICITAGLVIKKIRANARGRLHHIATDQIRILPSVQITPVETTGVSLGQDSRFTSTPHPKEINCLHGMIDLSQSLVALAEKYSLDEITLATADGLLLASSHNKHRQLMISPGTVEYIMRILMHDFPGLCCSVLSTRDRPLSEL